MKQITPFLTVVPVRDLLTVVRIVANALVIEFISFVVL